MPTYSETLINGVTDTYEHTIGFAYLRTSDIRVYIDDVLEAQGSGANKYVFSNGGLSITWLDGSEPQTGESLRIKRVTDISSARIVFAPGGGATANDLNNAVLQLLYAVDELQAPADLVTVTLTVLDSGNVTYPHKLGAIPTRFSSQLVCTSADQGYTSGDTLDLCQCDNVPSFKWDATNLKTDGDGWDAIEIHHATAGTRVSPAIAKWSVAFRSWR